MNPRPTAHGYAGFRTSEPGIDEVVMLAQPLAFPLELHVSKKKADKGRVTVRDQNGVVINGGFSGPIPWNDWLPRIEAREKALEPDRERKRQELLESQARRPRVMASSGDEDDDYEAEIELFSDVKWSFHGF